MARKLKVIKNEIEYRAALSWFDDLFDAPEDSPEADTLEVLSLLIEKFEEVHYKIDLPDPVDAIRFRMEQTNLTQKDLVPLIGSRSKVSEVLSGKRDLTLKMMRALHEHLGIPSEVLLQTPKGQLPAEWNTWEFYKFPLNNMKKNGAFNHFPHDSLSELKVKAEEAIRFLVEQAGGYDGLPTFAYRKTDGMRVNAKLDNYALLGWSLQVLAQAHAKVKKNVFYKEKFNRDFLEELMQLSMYEDGPLRAKKYLDKLGVILEIVPHLDKTYLDGATFLLQNGTPVIGMTLRYDRVDNFWFVLLHEIGHILLGHLNEEQRFWADDMELRDTGTEEGKEREADVFAEQVLLPPDFNLDRKEKISKKEIVEYARKIKRHPALVAGRIQYTKNNFHLFSQLLGRGDVRKCF